MPTGYSVAWGEGECEHGWWNVATLYVEEERRGMLGQDQNR
jgi:hypothetical protein